MKTLQWISGMLLILVTGVFWGTWFTLTRSIDVFPPDTFILIGKTIISNVAVPMRIIMPAAVLCLLILTWLTRKQHKAAFYLNLIALVLLVVTLIITVAIEVPIDNQIKTWELSTLPSGWQNIRLRWNSFHTIRTFTSLASGGFHLAGIVHGQFSRSY